jgi:hypothetical protein
MPEPLHIGEEVHLRNAENFHVATGRLVVEESEWGVDKGDELGLRVRVTWTAHEADDA